MTDEKKPLLSGDYGLTLTYLNEDLAWGMKVWRENGIPVYLYEVHYRDDEHPEPIYVREKMVGDPEGATNSSEMTVVPSLVKRLVLLLTDEDFRNKLRVLGSD